MSTTCRELRRECAPWSKRCLNVGHGKRIGNSDRSECSNRSCDASGHSVNVRRSIAQCCDPCGRRIVRHLCGVWIWRRSGAWQRPQNLGLTIGRARGLIREICSPERAKLVELQGAVERLKDLMRRYKQRRDARKSAPYIGTRHQDGGLGTRATLSIPTVREDKDDPMDVIGIVTDTRTAG